MTVHDPDKGCPDFCVPDMTDAPGEHVGEFEGEQDEDTGTGALVRPVRLDDGTDAVDLAVTAPNGTEAALRLTVEEAFELIRNLDYVTNQLGRPFLGPGGHGGYEE